MKRLMLFACFLFVTEFLYAQFYSGIKSQFVFPVNDKQEVDYGVGTDLQMGYSLGHKLDLDIGIGSLWFKSIMDNYQIRSVKANARYFIINSSAKPYIGLGTAYFHKSFDGPFGSEFSENGIGIIPSAGVVFNVKSVNGLSIITELSYNKIFFNHQVSLFSINLGGYYSFKRK